MLYILNIQYIYWGWKMGKSLVNIFSIYGKILAILITIVYVIYKYLLKNCEDAHYLDYVWAETPTEPDPMKGGDEAISRHSTEYNRAKLLPLLGQVMRVYLGEEHCQHHGQNSYQVHLPPVLQTVTQTRQKLHDPQTHGSPLNVHNTDTKNHLFCRKKKNWCTKKQRRKRSLFLLGHLADWVVIQKAKLNTWQGESGDGSPTCECHMVGNRSDGVGPRTRPSALGWSRFLPHSGAQ